MADCLRAYGTIDPHAAERDALIAAMVEMAATAVVTPGAAFGAAIGYMELAAAMAAAQQARQQRFAASDRSAAHEALAVGIVADQALVPLELGPTDIGAVVITDQNLPLLLLLADTPDDALAAVLDGNTTAGPAEHVHAPA